MTALMFFNRPNDDLASAQPPTVAVARRGGMADTLRRARSRLPNRRRVDPTLAVWLRYRSRTVALQNYSQPNSGLAFSSACGSRHATSPRMTSADVSRLAFPKGLSEHIFLKFARGGNGQRVSHFDRSRALIACDQRAARPCHVVESSSRKACASESFKLPRLPRATCSSPRREACDAFELRPDGVGR